MESRRRSIAKALSWRFLAVLITSFVAYLFTDDGAFAMKIGIADSLLKLLVYYLHERAWIRASYGRIEPAEAVPAEAVPAEATSRAA